MPGIGSSPRRMRSISIAVRITENMSVVLLSVPLAMVQPAARSFGIGGATPRLEAMPAWCETIVRLLPSSAMSASST